MIQAFERGPVKGEVSETCPTESASVWGELPERRLRRWFEDSSGYTPAGIALQHGKATYLRFADVAVWAACAAKKLAFSQQIKDTIAQVRGGSSVNARTDAAMKLAEMTRGRNSKRVDTETIRGIASLLDTPEDSVRAGVAACLGHFGRRARFTAPRLEAILAEVDCTFVDLSSASSIRPALRKIGVKPPDPNCPR